VILNQFEMCPIREQKTHESILKNEIPHNTFKTFFSLRLFSNQTSTIYAIINVNYYEVFCKIALKQRSYLMR
jgi:hypothetical protein